MLLATDLLPETGVDDDAQDLHADRDRLVRALALLTPRQRRVVVLRHVEVPPPAGAQDGGAG